MNSEFQKNIVLCYYYLRAGGGHKISSTGLVLSPPAGPESSLLNGAIRFELDDHEVGGRDEGLLGVVLAAAIVGTSRQSRDIDSSVLGATASQDLDGVEVALGVKLRKLEEAEKKNSKYN